MVVEAHRPMDRRWNVGFTLDIEADNEKAALAGAQQWYSVNAMPKEEAEARKTLAAAGGVGNQGDGSSIMTFASEALNTGMLNLPRNLDAGIKVARGYLGTGPEVSFADAYDQTKKIDEARATLNPTASTAGTLTGIAGPVVASVLSGGAATPTLLPAAAKLGVRMGAGALTGAAAGAADEYLDQGLISNNRDWGKVGTSAALSGLVGGGAVPVMDKVADVGGKLVNRFTKAPTGAPPTLSPEDAAKLQAAGLDPRSFGPEAAAAVARKGANDATARELQAQKFGIDLTKGQATQDFGEMRFENLAAQEGYGKTAFNRLSPFFEKQEQQIGAAKTAIGQQFGGKVGPDGVPVNAADDPLNAAGNIIADVRSKAATAKNEYKNLYADALGREGEFQGTAFQGLGGNITKSLQGEVEIDSMLTPGASRAVKLLDELRAPKEGDEVIGNVSLQEAEQMRKRLNAIRSAASNNPSDRRAVTAIIEKFDNHLEDSMANQLFSGDEGALDALKKARASFAKYQSTFKANRSAPDADASRWMQRIVETDVTAKEVSDALFGLSKIGEKGVSQRLAVRLQNTMGKDSDAWKGVRQGIWQKIVSKPEGKDDWGPQAMSERISSFLSEGSALARVTFSPDEQKVMREFASVLKTVRGPKIGGKTANPNSDTAAAMGGMLSRVMGKYDAIFGTLGLLADGATGGLGGIILSKVIGAAGSAGKNAYQGRRAAQAVQGAPTVVGPRATINPGIAAAPLAAAGGGLLGDDFGF
ncbi:hypothetical protein [Microvirga pudoricolor]|uniref:hypothetical protein n=1 Tax=Microvirga pudoricolor TaxID=2778729 RepID=UPI0019519574|nr:hypothetical protein [Microvirga pudoricolor]MBM6595561.1 hypothetical protein [Microvirga pudoricolor]